MKVIIPEKEEEMRANIIIHSISGNLYLIAETFREKLEERGYDARLYRVSDPDLHLAANERTEAIEYYEEITALPEAGMEKLESADIIILGTPSRFGMPTAEMKAFLDASWPLYQKKKLRGKRFYAFASSSVDDSDGFSAASCLYRWAGMMELSNIPYEPYVHKESEIMPNRPSESIDGIAEKLADMAAISDMAFSS